MNHFIKRFFGFSLGPVLGAIISFIQVPVLTYFLTVSEYGRAGGFQTLLVQIPNFIYLGLDQAYTREYHHHKDSKQLVQQAMLPPMVAGLALFLFFIIFDQEISTWLFNDPSYAYIAWYSGVWVLATVVERFMLLTIRMEERAVEYSMFSLALKLGVFIVSLLLIALGMRDFRVIVYGLIFGQILVDLLLFWRYRSILNLSGFQLDPVIIKQMFRFGLPVMIAASLSSILNSVDMVFLTQFASDSDKGIYSVAFKIASVIGILKTAFSSFWTPTAYRWYGEGKSIKHYQFISDAILFLLTGLFFGLLLIKKPITWMLDLAYSESMYGEVMYIVGLLSFPHIMYTLSETTTLGIVFSRRTHFNILVSLLSLVPSLLINYWLTPKWGYLGAALASTASYIIFYLARTFFSSLTGFYFSQRKQIISIFLMLLAGLINAYPIPYVEGLTLALGFLCLFVQWSTVQTGLDIRANSQDWDFN
ncbi:lipopolysaccharide biosynthesis protein [Hutsoniella sourekii]|uniref:lipopolysaccharide biosynthesis protein n=1 Tax=Hutsoniella sourekii TaxID=87650 RepID=UPI00048466FB|nr:lipopolysaccharide biosynthesis protein [Hutsoniella sourekii]